MNIQTPHSKNSDPETSHLAGNEITQSGKRLTQIKFVVELVKANQGKTGAELAALYGEDKYMIRRRLSDAKGLLLRQGKKRLCSASNKQAVTWWAL